MRAKHLGTRTTDPEGAGPAWPLWVKSSQDTGSPERAAWASQQAGSRARTGSPVLPLMILSSALEWGRHPLTQGIRGGIRLTSSQFSRLVDTSLRCRTPGVSCSGNSRLRLGLGSTPRIPAGPRPVEDLCTASPLLLLMALEAVEEGDKSVITATPQSCAPARGASL